MHENRSDCARLKRGNQHGNGYVRLVGTEMDVRQRDSARGTREQKRTHHQITSDVRLYAVRVFFVFFRVLRNIRRIVHDLEQIKERKYKDPDQIDKVPEKAAHLDAIREMFRVALIKLLADGQPHVNKHKHSAQHVKPMQTGNGEITGEIRAVSRQKHRRALDVFLFDCRNLVCNWEWEKVRSIHGRICRVRI